MEFLNDLGAWFVAYFEIFTGLKSDPAWKPLIDLGTGLAAFLGGCVSAWVVLRTILRFFGYSKKLTPNEKVLADHIADRVGKPEGDAVIKIDPDALAEALVKAQRVQAGLAPTASGTEDMRQEIEALKRAIQDLQSDRRTAEPKAARKIDDALAALAKGQTAKAEALFAESAAEDEARGTSANKDAARAWRNIGALAFLHDTKKALAAFGHAVELDPEDAGGWNQLGHLLDRSGDLDQAIKAYERVLALGNSTADQELIAIATGNLGTIFQTRGALDKAEEMYRKSLSIAEVLGHKDGMAIQYGNLGVVYKSRDELDRAEELYRKALAIDEELDGKEGMASSYGNFGNVYKARGDLDKAEQMYRKSLAIHEALGHKEGMAANYGSLGIVYNARDDLDKAEEMYAKSLAIEEALGRKEGMASDYGNLGNLYSRRGDLASACTHWRKSRDLFRAIGSPKTQQAEQSMRDAGCPE